MDPVDRAAASLAARFGGRIPETAIVLGSGLGAIADDLQDLIEVAAADVPGLPASGVAGHAGRIRLGRWAGREVLVFQGRVHLYEGHPAETATRAVRAAARLGAGTLLLTNAAGSCHAGLPPGSLMRATDLIDLFFRRLRGAAPPPFIGRGGVLDAGVGRRLDEAAILERIPLRHGVLCGSLGPSYETAAEVRLWRAIGASAACMSTVPEAFAARASGMRVGAISLVTNFGTGVSASRLDHAEVVEWAARAGEDLRRLLRRFVGEGAGR